MFGFQGIASALDGLSPAAPQPTECTTACRLCQRRQAKQARSGLFNFGQTLERLTYHAAAEISILIPHAADLDRYSKDHIEPDAIADQKIDIPTALKEIQSERNTSATPFVEFSYDDCPINANSEIRVLRLLSAKEVIALELNLLPELICCYMESVVPGQDGYAALSYTWGPSGNIPVAILPSKQAEGDALKQHIATIPATPQLFAAFSALRESPHRRIWVDQVSINQASDEEKMAQIGRMDEIYRQASQTVIWLGIQDKWVDVMKSMLERFLKDCKDSSMDADWVRSNLGLSSSQKSEQQQRNYDALVRILNREWFSRAWIFQEAVLSKSLSIQCGQTELPFHGLIRLSEAVYTVENQAAGYARSIMKSTVGYNTLNLVKHAKQECREPGCLLGEKLGPGHLFETLVLVLQHLRTSYSKDLINAFLGVVYQSEKDDATKPNTALEKPGPFGAKYSVEETWTEAAWHIIRTTNSLSVFTAANGGLAKLNIPSWVPDWSQCFKFASPITPPEFSTSFDASKGMPVKFRRSKRGDTIIVQGAIVDTITHFTTHDTNKYYFKEAHGDRTTMILRVHEQAAELRKQLGSNNLATTAPDEKLEHAVIRTMLADGAFGGQIIDDVHSVLDVYDLENDIKKLSGHECEDRILLHKMEEWGLIAQKKGLFLTENRMIGLAAHVASEGAQVGDIVAILAGSKVPCVLRPAESADLQFKVICQCYLDGFMYGEAGLGQDAMEIEII